MPALRFVLLLSVAWIFPAANFSAAAPAESEGRHHWSFQPPQRPAEPLAKNRAWLKNPIDAFILARLEREGIEPSAEADRVTLARRLSLDLLGLPPAPELVAGFVHDPSAAAYEKLVDQLLASPHFGEQWARHWLDLARYADTDGYEKDFYRPHAWRWRDWVINSINRDQLFDEFTRDQIAGDLLPNPTLEQRVATGFHRNTLLNREGGVDIEEDRCKIVVDRVSTVGTTWLGLTLGCAECHSHKYDPISQKEFYQFYAFFNSTDDRDIPAPRPGQFEQWEEAERRLAAAKRAYVEAADPELEPWTKEVAALPQIWSTPRTEDYELPTFGANNGANLYPQEDGSFLVTGMVENKTHYIMMLNTHLEGITAIRVEAMTDEMLPRLGPGWSTNGNFVLTELYVESAPLQDLNALRTNRIASVIADYSQEGFPVTAAIDGLSTNGGWAIGMPDLPIHAVDRCAVFFPEQKIGYPGGARLKVSLVQNEGQSRTLGRVRVTYSTSPRELAERQAVPQRIRDLAKIPRAERNLDQQVTLKRYFQTTFQRGAPELLAISHALADSPGVKGEVQAQTLAERRQLRPTRIHIRGNFLDKGAAVSPGTLAILHPLRTRKAAPGGSEGLPDRLDLANWLTDPANPLTARVTVNHIWNHLFGEGLVTTPADFGSQGERPSHPELLDWLATELLRLHWSRKALIREIVTSAAYRQQSAMRSGPAERDAKNRLIARQNRFRLSAENARDQQLAASGLLDPAIGGPSVASDSFRRGLYLQIRRANVDYLLTTFDAPASTQSCPRRERSNTPLQALTLMNDKVFVKCARALAAAVVAADAEPLHWPAAMFQRCLARRPDEREEAGLRELFEKSSRLYQTTPELAAKLVGEMKIENVPAADLAAAIVLARTILNLDELITRE